jgi:hypothetical protein
MVQPNRAIHLLKATARAHSGSAHCKSLKYVVRAQEQRAGNNHSQLLRRCHINHQLELGWLLDRKVRRLGTPKYLVDVRCRASKQMPDLLRMK